MAENKPKLKGSYKSASDGEFISHSEVESSDPNTVTKVAARRRVNVKQALTEFLQLRNEGELAPSVENLMVDFAEFVVKKKKK